MKNYRFQGMLIIFFLGSVWSTYAKNTTIDKEATRKVLTQKTATPQNIPDTVVKRNANGNFAAHKITADKFLGQASSAKNFTDELGGDVTGLQAATVVSQVGGKTALDLAITVTTVRAATSQSEPETLVRRDSFGNVVLHRLFVNEMEANFNPEPIDNSPFSGGGMRVPNCIAVSHKGKFVAASNPEDSTISVFAADAETGNLTPIIGSPFTGPILSTHTPQCLTFSHDDNFLAVTCTGSQSYIDIFSVDSISGALDEVLSYTVDGSPYGLEYSQDGVFLVVVSQPNTLYIYFVDNDTGSLTQIPNSPFELEINPYSLAITPNVDFLAVFDPVAELVSVIGGNPYTGVGADVEGSPFFTGPIPRTGQEPAQLRTPLTAGFVRYSPIGGFLATTNPNSNSIAFFEANPTTGVLTLIDNSIFIDTPYDVNFSPEGSHVVVAERGSLPHGKIRIFDIDQDSDLLIEAVPGGVDVGDVPYALAHYPTGLFLAAAMPINSKIAVVNVTEAVDMDATLSLNGNLELPLTSAHGGVVRLGGSVFLHGAGEDNVFLGAAAGNFSVSGSRNVGIGAQAFQHLTSGSDNIAIGFNAGDNMFTGTNNIYVKSPAQDFDESDTIRIGTDATRCFISGIDGATSASGVPVLVNSDGQLGTITSSQKFKRGIRPITTSDKLTELKPIEFKYNESIDPQGLVQYGLLAEDVAKVYPDLVTYDSQGQPYTIRYHLLVPLLLDAYTKQHNMLINQEQQIYALEQSIKNILCN